MKAGVNTYGGLNMDMSYDSIPSNFYIDALDIRITTTRGESQGSLTNIKGNSFSFLIPQEAGKGVCEIIGTTSIRNTIFLFVANDTATGGSIYKLTYDELHPETFMYLTLVYSHTDLNFNKLHPIEAIGRFESPKNQKLYWTDYNEDLRSLNTADPNVLTTDINLVNIHPNITYTQPQLTNISGGGSLSTGLYQIAYRLISKDGKQTLISPPSNMIHVISSSESLPTSNNYTGDPKGVNTFKALTISIDVTDYHSFDKIELISIFHEDLNGTPEITSIESSIIPSGNTFTFTYTGSENSIYPITTTEFALKTYAFSTCKTITQVDNSLLIANLKSNSFDVQERLTELGETFDAKVYRYKKVSATITKNTDVFNVDYNKDAHWDNDWGINKQYKFKANGTTLGGQGLNISYTFHTESAYIDESTGATPGTITNVPYSGVTPHNLSDGYTNHNTTFDGQQSPFISGLVRGYKRGETYRFGIVFYNKKGEASFVEYIGDVKFPDISDTDDIVNSTGGYNFQTATASGGSCLAHYLGIKFNIDFSTCPSFESEITGYQIVRVDRTNSDKRRMASGAIKIFKKCGMTTTIPSGGYDFRINGSVEVLHLMHYPGSTDNNKNGTFDQLINTGTTKGTHLTFYSPEISFDFNDITNSIVGEGNPLLLITGGVEFEDAQSSTYDSSGVEKLGVTVTDNVTIFHDVKKLTSSTGCEQYIRRFSNKEKVQYNNSMYESDMVANFEKHTPLFDGYYMRNFYAESNDLNNASLYTSYLYKGSTGITGSIKKITSDPLTNAALGTIPSNDYFDNAITHTADNDNKVILDILIPKNEIYGGMNQSALENNIFIQASPFIEKSNTTPIVYGGDMFINMFVFQTSSTYNNNKYYDNANDSTQIFGHNISKTELFPIESCVNQDLNYGTTVKNGVTYNVGTGAIRSIWRQETDNIFNVKSSDMYKYNSVYSKIGSDLTFVVKPEDLIINNTNDIRAMISNVKINDEIIDSWTKFGLNNYWDVDDHGPINKILRWKSNTYFFQDTAIGNYIINPVSLITGQSGVTANLGTGEGIVRHQYLSTVNGSIHQWGIKDTDTAIYCFDAIAKKIHVITDGVQPLSEIKGIHGFLNSLDGPVIARKENYGDNPFKQKGICIGKDNVNDEVLFTFHGLHNAFHETLISKTLVYDELVQQFTASYTTTPPIYIGNKNVLVSPNLQDPTAGYLHNHGDYGSFYGTTTECFIKMVVNHDADLNKVIRFLEFNSIVRDVDKVIDRDVTITAFQIDTENQSTGKVLFSTDRFKHKFNKWRLKIPRDQNSVSQQGRLRNTYFIVTLYFDNTSNKELILNRLITYYDDQMF